MGVESAINQDNGKRVSSRSNVKGQHAAKVMGKGSAAKVMGKGPRVSSQSNG